MCSKAWICCFCPVNFSGKREKAIHARRGLGEKASKTRKADGQAAVFLYMNILLHLPCLRCSRSLNPRPVLAQVSGDWWCTRLEGITVHDPASHSKFSHRQNHTGIIQLLTKKPWFDSSALKHHQTSPHLCRRL